MRRGMLKLEEKDIWDFIRKIYQIHEYTFYDVFLLILEHVRQMESLLNRKLSEAEINESIDMTLIFLTLDS